VLLNSFERNQRNRCHVHRERMGSQSLTCEECGREAETVGEALRWRAYLTAAIEEEGEGEGVAVYCPDCAQREFESSD
jgi:hypothetical protein